MADQKIPFTDCRLMTAIRIAVKFSADYGSWLISEVKRDRPSFAPGPEQDGDPLDQFDGSAVYGVTTRLAYFLQHIPIVYQSGEDRDELIELLEAVLEQMHEHRAERSRRGLIGVAWSVSAREIERAIKALQQNVQIICVHNPTDDAEVAAPVQDETGFTDGGGI
ncbi:MAG: hypothetical protein U0136_10085 [Bdellovibrionota bacterium]